MSSISLPSIDDVEHDPSLRRIVLQWERSRAIYHSGRSQMTREERRQRQQAERAAKAAREATIAADGAQAVLLIRHGEAAHNANWRENGTEVDPRLTERGHRQAETLADHPAVVGCELLVVAPLSRAVQTAAAAFGERPSYRTVLTPLHSERLGSAACNKGSPKSVLVHRFPFIRDWEGFGEMTDEWWPRAELDAHEGWRERVRVFIEWLHRQPQRKVIVIGHGAFFSDSRLAGRMLANCEIAVLRVQNLTDRRGTDADRTG